MLAKGLCGELYAAFGRSSVSASKRRRFSAATFGLLPSWTLGMASATAVVAEVRIVASSSYIDGDFGP